MSEIVPFTTRALSLLPCADDPGHERRIRGQSGIWACTLTTKTPLCIHSYFRNLKDTDKAFVPASSLRGMVRNMAEMLGAGCARFLEGSTTPANLRRCSELNACIACRMFGFVNGEFAWAGKVRFSDTQLERVEWVKYQVPSTRPPQVAGEGWVLFPHELPKLSSGATRCVDAGTVFRFRAEYLNLSPEELAVFQFALTLSFDKIDLVHKLDTPSPSAWEHARSPPSRHRRFPARSVPTSRT